MLFYQPYMYTTKDSHKGTLLPKEYLSQNRISNLKVIGNRQYYIEFGHTLGLIY